MSTRRSSRRGENVIPKTRVTAAGDEERPNSTPLNKVSDTTLRGGQGVGGDESKVQGLEGVDMDAMARATVLTRAQRRKKQAAVATRPATRALANAGGSGGEANSGADSSDSPIQDVPPPVARGDGVVSNQHRGDISGRDGVRAAGEKTSMGSATSAGSTKATNPSPVVGGEKPAKGDGGGDEAGKLLKSTLRAGACSGVVRSCSYQHFARFLAGNKRKAQCIHCGATCNGDQLTRHLGACRMLPTDARAHLDAAAIQDWKHGIGRYGTNPVYKKYDVVGLDRARCHFCHKEMRGNSSDLTNHLLRCKAIKVGEELLGDGNGRGIKRNRAFVAARKAALGLSVGNHTPTSNLGAATDMSAAQQLVGLTGAGSGATGQPRQPGQDVGHGTTNGGWVASNTPDAPRSDNGTSSDANGHVEAAAGASNASTAVHSKPSDASVAAPGQGMQQQHMQQQHVQQQHMQSSGSGMSRSAERDERNDSAKRRRVAGSAPAVVPGMPAGLRQLPQVPPWMWQNLAYGMPLPMVGAGYGTPSVGAHPMHRGVPTPYASLPPGFPGFPNPLRLQGAGAGAGAGGNNYQRPGLPRAHIPMSGGGMPYTSWPRGVNGNGHLAAGFMGGAWSPYAVAQMGAPVQFLTQSQPGMVPSRAAQGPGAMSMSNNSARVGLQAGAAAGRAPGMKHPFQPRTTQQQVASMVGNTQGGGHAGGSQLAAPTSSQMSTHANPEALPPALNTPTLSHKA